MEQRERFVILACSDRYTIKELCEKFGVSRKTGHKWLSRYRELGNGCHERMHRTMKAECCKKPSVDRRVQQQRFNRWRKEFNEERPHEALGMKVPSEVYQASSMRLDEAIKRDIYELGAETKKVAQNGSIMRH